MSIDIIDAPTEIEQFLTDRPITNLMLMIWLSRRDLQQAFDIHSKAGQEAFINWYDVSVTREYGINPRSVLQKAANVADRKANSNKQLQPRLTYLLLRGLESRLLRVSRYLPQKMREKGKVVWLRFLAKAARASARAGARADQGGMRLSPRSSYKQPQSEVLGFDGEPGANLIGYAHAEVGMGEHVRMTAAAMLETKVPFRVVNFNIGVPSRQKASFDQELLADSNNYKTNIFHINADQMLLAYSRLGRPFFSGRYNIGYWAWELAKCPDEWLPVFSLVDELWAPSRFIQNAFSERTALPVVHMPLCVTLPAIPKYSRHHFGLPERSFLFLFTFDFFSYIARKNPFASILAFQKAFNRNRNDVGLVIKAMNGDEKNANWGKMLELIDGDPRIFVLNNTMDRMEILGLFDSCDCFISLHRSEGFGRGPAEAMYLGKPVIVTNYSGNTDFTLADNSCLVDYKLVPVEQGEYIFEKGQIWADPDIEHAAWYMDKLVSDSDYYQHVGQAGANYIHTHYSQRSIGNMYQKRLKELGLFN